MTVQCWKIKSNSDGSKSIVSSFTNDKCPVQLDIPVLSGKFHAGEKIPIFWNVDRLGGDNIDNEMDMPLPVSKIDETYVRTCESVAKCDPTLGASVQTKPQSGSFNDKGDTVTFSSSNELEFTTSGDFPVSAQAHVYDSTDGSISYYFAAYTTLTVQSNSTAGGTGQQLGVVNCRMSRMDALNETLDASTSVQTSDNCEIAVKLNPLSVVKPNGKLDVSWRATMARGDDKDIHLPTPLTSATVDGQSYQVVSSAVKLCKSDANCNEFTAASDLSVFAKGSPASFNDGSANLVVKDVKVPTKGWDTAFLHFVLAGPSRRYDFTYYFQLVASDSDIAGEVEKATYNKDDGTNYCWEVLADGGEANVTANSVATAGKGDDCPYVLGFSMPDSEIEADASIALEFTVAERSAFSRAKFPSIDLSTVYDGATQEDVNVPIVDIYACPDGSVCTPFSANKTLIYSAPARSLSDGKTTVSGKDIKFPGEGKFTVMVHAVLPNTADRIDMMALGSITVGNADGKESSGGGSNTTLIVVIVVVVVLVLVLGFAWYKRRQRQRMDKLNPVMFGAPPIARSTNHNLPTASRGSMSSEPSGSFGYHRAERSPAEGGHSLERHHDSLSYDPYQRQSFMNMSVDESNLSFAFSDDHRPSIESEAYDV
ncbi:hypothetical protein Poli38472_008877 [Pythium oligandrum]|uniref:Uncharacterized protein n=1 Tax=Pythium oligandrum TaxID=41045 RepID=A0A8K1C493_PYTOL|nr:hypothetical protein Poli38472_008877 [Pythium oligandrum]|eukprot:TMW56229.1 hypothetical protein Poli38472_008877 [Pythium oligandrum]